MFVTDLLDYVLCSGHWILQQYDYLADVAPSLSWLPAAPLSLSSTRVSAPTHPNQVVFPTHGHRSNSLPDPEGFNSQSVFTHFPLRFAHRGPTSFANFSPLVTSFDAYVYGGSRDLSNYGGPRPYARTLMGGASTSGGGSVMLTMTGSLLPTSLDSSKSSPPEIVNHPVAPAVQ
jgi:hypothetical protein